ncbi:hypothetical protein PLIIFM63780_002254 [Purpureocillium lilacinum]|nr:hypothetical protein PLIIFM63780_002254 [Purpureocillium lilacinum]
METQRYGEDPRMVMEDRSGQIVAVNVAFMVLTTIVIGLRIYCRGWIIRSFGIDDYTMFVTWVRSSATTYSNSSV